MFQQLFQAWIFWASFNMKEHPDTEKQKKCLLCIQMNLDEDCYISFLHLGCLCLCVHLHVASIQHVHLQFSKSLFIDVSCSITPNADLYVKKNVSPRRVGRLAHHLQLYKRWMNPLQLIASECVLYFCCLFRTSQSVKIIFFPLPFQ